MAVAVSSPFSSQEQHNLPLRAHVDTNPFAPPPSGQAALVDNALQLGDSGFAGLSCLQDIVDFDRETESSFTLLPSKKAKKENVVKLQQRGDKQQIRPDYEVVEVFQENFKAKVLYAGRVYESLKLFPSKGEAKDAAAKVALEQLPCMEIKQVAGQKRKKSDNRSPSPIDKSENWIGILMNNHAQKKKFEPDFLEHESSDRPSRFFCEIRLNGGPLQLFNAGIFFRRQDAKAASAKLAVDWLRREGHLEILTKRPKTDLLHTGLTQAVAAVDMHKEPITKPMRFRQRVYEAAAMLGFQQPSCQPTLSTRHNVPGGSFYDAESIFKAIDVEREPTLAGPIGRVQHVFGKNNAKEACSERVLPILEEIKRRRLAQR